MTKYPPEMYEEILKDYNWSWGKFNPIPYPSLKEQINVNWKDKNDNQS